MTLQVRPNKGEFPFKTRPAGSFPSVDDEKPMPNTPMKNLLRICCFQDQWTVHPTEVQARKKRNSGQESIPLLGAMDKDDSMDYKRAVGS
mmetsp:Transcript_12386/g.28685  ORF Transcript_12386/g.28685 Transcript_12386/m.28685 type:complete len:90 (-) Transcript_12386:392-661(-)